MAVSAGGDGRRFCCAAAAAGHMCGQAVLRYVHACTPHVAPLLPPPPNAGSPPHAPAARRRARAAAEAAAAEAARQKSELVTLQQMFGSAAADRQSLTAQPLGVTLVDGHNFLNKARCAVP